MTSQQCVIFLRKMAGRRWLPHSWRDAFAWSAECISTLMDDNARIRDDLYGNVDKLKAEIKRLEEENRGLRDYSASTREYRDKEHRAYLDKLSRIVAIAHEEMK